VSPLPKERLQRVLQLPRRPSSAVKAAILFGVLALAGVAVALYDRTPTLSHLRVSFLSGGERGNYYAVVKRLGEDAAKRRGRIRNISTAGSVENITRLVAGRASCDVQFALVQDGMAWPEGDQLELIGRLSTPESLVVLGRDADRIRSLTDLRGKRIGIGPVGSGTERVARQILTQLKDLNLQISTPSMDDQIAKLQSGELDLGAMVIDANAKLLTDVVRDGKLQMLNIAGAEVLAHRLPFAGAGVIPAGNYDPVRQLPPEDQHVIQIDTLVVGNGCASWSTTQGLITALTVQFPDFVQVNRERRNRTGLNFAPAARAYFDNDGPDVVGVHAPWLVDLLPTASWIQLIFGFSILFNATAFAHRFRLWRIDAKRVELESEIPLLFAPGITVGEIGTMTPDERQRSPEARARVDGIIDQLVALLERCRKHSLSVLVPMGQEMSYRYQEALIADLLRSLRAFRARLK
jgi:TRAP-type uncharacterized transport system substrate-binding protein